MSVKRNRRSLDKLGLTIFPAIRQGTLLLLLFLATGCGTILASMGSYHSRPYMGTKLDIEEIQNEAQDDTSPVLSRAVVITFLSIDTCVCAVAETILCPFILLEGKLRETRSNQVQQPPK